MAQTSSERLTAPLIRENGKHRPATWEEALDRVAEGIRREVAQHGPRTFGMFSCSKTTNELNYTAQKFVRSVVGSNNIDSCNRT
jgi:predicted molibdopterin-dependent oxidoreductase YjgC